MKEKLCTYGATPLRANPRLTPFFCPRQKRFAFGKCSARQSSANALAESRLPSVKADFSVLAQGLQSVCVCRRQCKSKRSTAFGKRKRFVGLGPTLKSAKASQLVRRVQSGEAIIENGFSQISNLIAKGDMIHQGSFLCKKKTVLEIVQQVKDAVCKKQLIESSTSVIVMISGGQDSIFLLFCLSFLQSKIVFTFKMLWCNHFWQTDSFYTTLHLTMCAVNFEKTLITFLPLFVFDSDLLIFNNGINQVAKPPQAPAGNNVQILTPVTNLLWRSHPRTSIALPGIEVYSLVAKPPAPSGQCPQGKSFDFVRKKPSGIMMHLRCSDKSKHRRCKPLRAKICRYWWHLQSTPSKPLRAKIMKVPVLCVQKTCTALRLPKVLREQTQAVYSGKLSFATAKPRICTTSETIARHWRHLTTERSSTFYTLERAIYGHTLSDRVETIMFNLIRGAGNTGIQSLLWKRKFSTFFYNWFFLSFQHVLHNTHFSTSVIQYHRTQIINAPTVQRPC